MASLNLNKVILSGHLAETPELKQTNSGIPVCQLRLMVNRRKKADGTQECDAFNVVAWRGTAEFACRYFKKGQAMCVSGSLQTRSWTDQSNQKRYQTEVMADELYFVDSANGGGQAAQSQTGASENSTGAAKASPTTQQAQPAQQAQMSYQELAADDDLPF